MRVELIERFQDLEDEWPRLRAADPTSTPFTSYEWTSVWCRHWAEGGRPWILAVYDGDRLAGLVPFLMHRRAGLRLLRGLGLGVGNYWDAIADPDERAQVLAAVAADLSGRGAEWDAFFMDKLPEESTTIAALLKAGLRVEPTARLASPRIELPATFEEYLAGVSPKRRAAIRRSLRPLDSGQLSVHTATTGDEIALAVERWQRLKVESWRQRNLHLDPEHRSPRFRDFTTEALTSMVPAGLAVVWEIRDEDKVLVVTIGLLDEHAYYGWLIGFDPRCEQLEPGHMAIARGIRWSIDQGLRYYDFMLGAESYKYHYAPTERSVLAAVVGNGRPRSRATLGVGRLRRALRRSGAQDSDPRSSHLASPTSAGDRPDSQADQPGARTTSS
ncbi:MAG TPA: GNAT family N-acetyltransferase [Solirubrobacteraceae bacterium]|nr:GNAT family N-acetyltransferase [Solirubrobacteraceae bacterium]